MAIRYLDQLCIVMVLFFYKVTDAAWTLTGSSEFAVAKEDFVLTCIPDNTGTAIIWRRSGITLAAIEYNNRCDVTLPDTKYQYTCEPGPVYKLTISANVMTNSQNNIVWRCESTFGGIGNNAEYTLKVAVPVSSVYIQGDSGYPAVNVIYESIPKTFTCVTNGCRPKAYITVIATGATSGQKTERQSTQSDGLIVTFVSQSITATRGGGLKTFQCSAVNIQGRQPVISPTLTLDVYYIPTIEPTLSGYTTGTVLYEGDNYLTITCQQSGGYPLSVITWSCNRQTGTSNSSRTVTSSYVQITVNRYLKGKTCTCTVRHPHITTYTRTKSLIFTVYYPPTNPTVQTSGTNFPWVENTLGVLKCITTPGNPQDTTYEWLQNSMVINKQTTDTYTIPTLTNVHNRLRIQCKVSNLYTMQRPPSKVSNITILDVQYTPIITLDTTNLTVQEGDNPSRKCSAIGNPTPTVKWYRGNSEQTFGKGTSATLVFRNIDRNQADTYQCKATATGKMNFESSKSLSVIVFYPPAVTVSLQNATENDTNVVFTCNADGFPTNNTYHGWNQYIDNTLVRSYIDFTGMLSESNRKVTIPKVTFEDIGQYYCVVENGFRGRKQDVLQQGSSYFDVRASAKFEPKESARKPGELHKNLTINIKFYSNPPAKNSDIKWINKITTTNQLTDFETISLNLISTVIQRIVYGKVVSLRGQSAMLTIASLQSFHLGYYQLKIQNGGNLSSSFDFQIIIPAKPEPPKNLIVYETQHNLVTLTWERGYDGGYHQIFVILVKDVESDYVREILVNDDAKSNNLTTTIEDLLPSTTYHIKIFAMNEYGNSSFLSLNFVKETIKVCLNKSYSGNGQVITTSVIIVILCVVIIVLAIIIWRRGQCISSKDNGSKRGEKSEVRSNYEGVSQNYQERNLYEGIQTDQEHQSGSREAGAYESLESRDVETKNTYESLQTTDRPDSGGIAMELYENTKITL